LELPRCRAFDFRESAQDFGRLGVTDFELFDREALDFFAEDHILALADPVGDRIFFANWTEFFEDLICRTIIHETLHIVIALTAGLQASQALDILERDHLNPSNLEGF
jgi:hypothetical protein